MSRTSNNYPLLPSTSGAPRWFARAAAWLSIIPALVATAPRARGQQGAAPLRFTPCGNATRVVECAQLAVRERPRDTKSQQLALRVVRIRQDRTAPATTATFVLAGGPGSRATEMARGDISAYDAWAEHGDVVFLDQRGTEEGSPLWCPVGADFDPFTGIFPPVALSRCHGEAARVVDLTAYGTEDAAQDIETARVALGYRQLNLVAVSYGTRLAMEYMERFPGSVRAAVLDGVAPRELRAPLYYVADAEASLRRWAELCRADGQCRRYGDPAARYRAVLSRLSAMPATATIRTRPSGPERQVTVRPGVVAYAVRGLLYGERAVELPRLLARADSTGDVTALAQFYAQRVTGGAALLSQGLNLRVLCAEDVATLTPARIREVAATTIAGTYLADQYVAACERWRVPAGRSDTVTPRLARPLLLLSGALDPVTPPRWGEVVRARSTSARHVVFPFGGHGYPGAGMSACKAQLVHEFLRTGRPDRLDTSCTARAAPPRFPPPA